MRSNRNCLAALGIMLAALIIPGVGVGAQAGLRVADLHVGDRVRVWQHVEYMPNRIDKADIDGVVHATPDSSLQVASSQGTVWSVPVATIRQLQVRGTPTRSWRDAPGYALAGAAVGALVRLGWRYRDVSRESREGYSYQNPKDYKVAAGVGAVVGAMYGGLRRHARWTKVATQ